MLGPRHLHMSTQEQDYVCTIAILYLHNIIKLKLVSKNLPRHLPVTSCRKLGPSGRKALTFFFLGSTWILFLSCVCICIYIVDSKTLLIENLSELLRLFDAGQLRKLKNYQKSVCSAPFYQQSDQVQEEITKCFIKCEDIRFIHQDTIILINQINCIQYNWERLKEIELPRQIN